jgi:hypothetical protein
VQLISIGLGREAVLLLRRVKTRLAQSGHEPSAFAAMHAREIAESIRDFLS